MRCPTVAFFAVVSLLLLCAAMQAEGMKTVYFGECKTWYSVNDARVIGGVLNFCKDDKSCVVASTVCNYPGGRDCENVRCGGLGTSFYEHIYGGHFDYDLSLQNDVPFIRSENRCQCCMLTLAPQALGGRSYCDVPPENCRSDTVYKRPSDNDAACTATYQNCSNGGLSLVKLSSGKCECQGTLAYGFAVKEDALFIKPACKVENCAWCTEEDSNQCETCDSGYYYSKLTSKCVEGFCDVENCDTCTAGDENTCNVCSDGYYKNSNTGKCVFGSCSVANCAECAAGSDSQCKDCIFGHSVMPDGQCQKVPCSLLNCLTCEGKDSNRCAVCPEDMELDANSLCVFLSDESSDAAVVTPALLALCVVVAVAFLMQQ